MLPLARPSIQPRPLPATPPPLARPFIPCPLLVLADRASAARPASSSTLSRHTPPPTRTRAATHLHTTAPCARSTLFIAAPHSFHHHLHFTPLAPASRNPTSEEGGSLVVLRAAAAAGEEVCVFRHAYAWPATAFRLRFPFSAEGDYAAFFFLERTLYTSRFVRVILAQGPC